MSETKSSLNTFGRIILFLLVLAAVVVAVAILIKMFGAFILALMGIGLIVFFHELGHFTVAKLTDINVQAFSIGFPPVLLTIKRIEDGYLVKILPGAPKVEGGEPTALLKFTLPAKCQAGETEYRIGLIPFGGFVKMLGQDDTKVEKSDDPRSYTNKRVGIRMAVIVAGVLFNALLAAGIFIGVFLKGINLTPPVIGEVMPNSPAERAGLEPGDEFIMINGRKSNLQFMHIFEAAALSGNNEAVPVTVKKRDGEIEDLKLVAENIISEDLKSFGIGMASSLTIAKLSGPSAWELADKTNFQSGDIIVSVNGRDVNDYFDLTNEVENLYKPTVTLLARRQLENDPNMQLVETEIPVEFNPCSIDANNETDLFNIASIVPPLKIAFVSPNVEYTGEKTLEYGDVIIRIGDVNYPTYIEMRQVTNEYANKPLEIEILRTDANGIDHKHIVKVVPQKEGDRVIVGTIVCLDLSGPVVAKTVENQKMQAKLDIDKGSRIIAVNGQKTTSMFDVIEQIRNTSGPEITFEFQNQQGISSTAKIQAGQFEKTVTVKGTLAEAIPFEPLERVYKAKNPLTAIGMGFNEMVGYFRNAILTLRRFVAGQVNPKNFMGPVGIVKFSYDIVKNKSLVYYIYFLGLINAFIAVFNSIPFLPFDGGHVVLLGIEKITGKPVNERVQAAMVYAGLILVLAFALYITFNDIVRIFKPPL